jgi:glutaconate CoA-transferase subunit A
VGATLSVDELAGRVGDGALIAIGGAGLQRKPMAALRALVRAGRRELRVISFLGSLDVELLLAAGAVAELHSAGVSLEAAGLAPRYRAAREGGRIRFVEWSEATLMCALEAAARGVPSLPTWAGLESDLPALNPWLQIGEDPFTGEPVMHVRALAPEVALAHVPAIDDAGYAYVDGDLAFDGVLARAAGQMIVSHDGWNDADPRAASLSRLWIDATVHAPGGAWPTGCMPLGEVDRVAVAQWASAGPDAPPALLEPRA